MEEDKLLRWLLQHYEESGKHVWEASVGSKVPKRGFDVDRSIFSGMSMNNDGEVTFIIVEIPPKRPDHLKVIDHE